MTNKQALDALDAIIRQKKGFYAISVGHDEVKKSHKAGILKGLDVVHEEVKKLMTASETALTQPNQALVEALKTIANMPESGSNDLEIKIAKEALSASEAQPAQTVVEVENNIKLLCHECGKTHEHEYNKPPRHGSCEVCGRQSMLCTRVMTEAARLQLERQKMGGI